MSTPRKTATTAKEYDVSDVKHLLRVRSWKSYSEMIGWLKKEGDADSKFTPGEVSHLVDDLSRVKLRGTEFITDPVKLHEQLMHR